MKNKRDIISRLEKEMQKTHRSPEDVSRMIGCSCSQVYRWINRESKPSYLSRNAIDRAIKKMRRISPIISIEMRKKDRDLYRKLKKHITLKEKQELFNHADDYGAYQRELSRLAKKHNVTE